MSRSRHGASRSREEALRWERVPVCVAKEEKVRTERRKWVEADSSGPWGFGILL